MANADSALLFFLQLAAILIVCRGVGSLAARFGQPRAVAEMLAGILLGPSLLGYLLPEWQAWLFPWDKTQMTRDTQSYLYPVSQLGLALYTFIVGLEFRADMLRQNMRPALAVAAVGLVAPFLLGLGTAWWLWYHTALFPQGVALADAMLFFGAAMSITAFPTLARIIDEKGLTGTRVGTVAISAGALNDAGAWCILAMVMASAEHTLWHSLGNIAAGAGYIALVLFVVKPLLVRVQGFWVCQKGDASTLTDTGFACCLTLMALGAWFTELIGLHAVFGGFIMGAAMPRGVISQQLVARLYPITTVVLLPLFFTYSGLNTHIGLLDSKALWLVGAGILVVAILGKAVACWLAAWAAGMSTRESLGVGALMNARGLMELVIINIGLQRCILSEPLFAALALMALMAVVTTLMTVPLFDRVMRARD